MFANNIGNSSDYLPRKQNVATVCLSRVQPRFEKNSRKI